jgi:heterodisulfide reductase subunit A
VIDAIAFLREINQGDRKLPGRQVAVVGGGNVAIDAARTAKRLGADKVTIVYRRSEQEMPAYAEEIRAPGMRASRSPTLTAPVRILASDGRVSGIRMHAHRTGPSGRQRPTPAGARGGSEFVIDCDAVIPAIGQRTDVAWAEEDARPGPDRPPYPCCESPRPCRHPLPMCLPPAMPWCGPATVIEAVAAGHKAVAGHPTLLQGKTWTNSPVAWRPSPRRASDWAAIPEGIAPVPRVQPAHNASMRPGRDIR